MQVFNKRALLLIVLLMTLGLICVGCNETPVPQEEARLDAPALASQLLQEIEFPTMLDVAPNRLSKYYPFDGERFVSAVVYQSFDPVADEIVILQVQDAADLEQLQKDLQGYYEERETIFADYAPQESGRIKQRLTVEKDRWLISVISSANDTAEKLIDAAFQNATAK